MLQVLLEINLLGTKGEYWMDYIDEAIPCLFKKTYHSSVYQPYYCPFR